LHQSAKTDIHNNLLPPFSNEGTMIFESLGIIRLTKQHHMPEDKNLLLGLSYY
jgi:hypothetical protein